MASVYQQMVLDVQSRGISETVLQMRKLSDRMNEFRQRTEQAERQLAKMEARQKTSNSAMGQSIRSLVSMAAGYVSLRVGISILESMFNAWRKQEIAIRKTQQLLQTTGRSYEITNTQLQIMASNLQKISNLGDEEIIDKVFGKLLRYTRIASADYERVGKAIINLSATGLELATASEIVGRALESPSQASRQLRTASIMLTKSERELITELENTGRVAEAQDLILKKLESTTKNLAEATRDPVIGMANAFGDLKEAVMGLSGESVMSAFMGGETGIRNLTSLFTDMNKQAVELINNMPTLTRTARTETTALLIAELEAKRSYMASGGGFFGTLLDTGKLYLNWLQNNAPKMLNFIPGFAGVGTVIDKLIPNKPVGELYTEKEVSLIDKQIKNLRLAAFWTAGLEDKVKAATNTNGENTDSIKEQNDAIKEQREELRKIIPEYENLEQMQDYVYDNMLKNLNEISEATAEALKPKVQWFDEFKTTWKQFGTDFADIAQYQISGALSNMILSHETGTKKLKSIWNSLVNSIISELARYAAALLIFNLGKLFLSGGTSALFGGSGVDLIPSVPIASYNGGFGGGSNSQIPTVSNERSMSNTLLSAVKAINDRPVVLNAYFHPRDIALANELGTQMRFK